MKSSKSISAILAIVVACAPMAGLANSEHEKLSAGLRTPSPSMLAPIGTIESLEAVEINGVLVKRDAPVWSGDIVQAAPATTSRIAVKGAGEVLLRGGAAVKLNNDLSAQRLTAVVIKGEMSVTLNPEFSAQIQIGERIYVVSKGAKLNAAWRDGEPVLQTSKGSVMVMGSWSVDNTVASNEQQATPRRTLIKPYNLGASTDVRARSTRSVQVRVTDENDKPIPDAPVIFLISGGSVGGGGAAGAGGASGGAGAAGVGGGSFAGQTSVTVTTNAQGIASTNFTASNINGSSARIRASVQGTDAVWEETFRIVAAKSGFWSPQTAVPVFAIIGAAVGIGIYKIATKKGPVTTPDITQRPGSVILP